MMQKIFWMMIILIFLILIGCTPETNDFADLYQITEMLVPIDTPQQKGTIHTPAKFNPVTGSLTPLCTDPVCSHGSGSGCSFAEVGNIIFYANGRAYFEKEAGGEKYMMYYDTATMSTRKLLSMNDLKERIPEEVTVGVVERAIRSEYLFVGYRDGIRRVACFRVGLADGKIETLDAANPWPRHTAGDKYIFLEGDVTPATGISVATDIDGRNRRILVENAKIKDTFDTLLTEDILLYLSHDEAEGVLCLHTYNLADDTDTVLCPSVGAITPVAVGRYLYYVDTVENPPLIGYDGNEGREVYNTSGGILWRLDIDTGELTEAFAYPTYQLRSDKVEVVGPYVVVEYRNTDYTPVEGEEDIYFGTIYEYPFTQGRIVYDTENSTSVIYEEGTYTGVSWSSNVQ